MTTHTPVMLTLRECAHRLGVHYMTAYKYVRMGRLPAVKSGSEWRVSEADLEAFVAVGPEAPGPSPWADRLAGRLLVGDQMGAWGVVEAAMASGLEPARVHLEVLVPALRAIGDGWAAGTVSIAAEHRASAVAAGLIGRLSPRFTRRGRKRGRVVIGSPPGERHAMPVAIAADFMRADGWEVISLGVDLPIDEFVKAAGEARPLTAVAVSVTNPESAAGAIELAAALRAIGVGPIVLGGSGLTDDLVARSGCDAWAQDAPGAVAVLDRLTG